TKTLAALAKRDSIKSLVTQIAVGGALGGLDHTMGWGKLVEGKGVVDPIKAQLPLLSNQNWSQVAQRVAAQSIVSSTIGTAINGGSFTDNLQTALLSNIGNQINAEGAKLIGDQGQILDVPGKAISHAAVSALAAEISGGDAKGAAVGALAAELAAITLDKTFSDPMAIQAGGKIIGGAAGAIATNSAEGANSGANAGEMVIVYNSLAHLLSAAEKEKSGTLKTYEEKKQAFCQQSPEACKQAGGVISFGTDFVPIVGDIKGFVEAESALDYLAAAVAIIPGAGDAAGKTIKAVEKALQKGDIGEASKLLNKASDEITSVSRPSHRKSEIDVGKDLGDGWNGQVTFKEGKEVPYGTKGSVRPDWCQGNICSVEVKNYNIATNKNGLINNVAKQAIERQKNLPAGMEQRIVIDVRGQTVSLEQEREIIKGIVQKSNGIIDPAVIEFKG
ncbi:DUF637 domain-containing protein, partial [Photorhabdus kayaii]